ncbi:MAG TPA: hypothetical protein VF185_02335 [Patescibacteria group bacterium]
MEERRLRLIKMEPGQESLRPSIKFEGFVNPEHQKFVKEGLTSIGLPTDNIKTLRFINADSYVDAKRQWFILGHYNHQEGEYALYKLWGEKIPPIGQMGTMVHELGHANSPLYEENDALFGGKENREKAAEHAQAVAEQTLKTGVFLNPYHKQLSEMLAAGAIDGVRFVEETHAIMAELRFTNLAHLEQVEESQEKKLRAKGLKAISIVKGIDQTLINLMSRNNPRIKTSHDLDNHIFGVKSVFFQDQPKSLPKAA